MTSHQILFIVLGAITLAAALMVVTRRDVRHAALFLVLTFFSVAGLHVLFEAPFLAAVYLLIYGGCTATFAVITLRQNMMDTPEDTGGHNRQWWAAALVTAALFGTVGGLLRWIALHPDWAVYPTPASERSITALLALLVNPEGLALPFAVSSVLLLITLVSATTIARTH
jgi:NADH-quinone oxidoreductase subunit J